MPKWMKSCKNRGFIGPMITNFGVNGTNFERKLYYWLCNLRTTLNLSSSFKKSIARWVKILFLSIWSVGLWQGCFGFIWGHPSLFSKPTKTCWGFSIMCFTAWVYMLGDTCIAIRYCLVPSLAYPATSVQWNLALWTPHLCGHPALVDTFLRACRVFLINKKN